MVKKVAFLFLLAMGALQASVYDDHIGDAESLMGFTRRHPDPPAPEDNFWMTPCKICKITTAIASVTACGYGAGFLMAWAILSYINCAYPQQ